MPIETYLGATIDEPIRNGVVTEGDLRTMWDAPVKLREKAQMRMIPGKPLLSYTLLRYIPGLVTYCSLGATPVWTGYMSGCFLFRFLMGGRLYAAHVGTDDTSKEKNDKVKAVWRAFADSGAVTEVMGYNPAREVPTATLMAVRQSGKASGVTGWWEANGTMRIVMLAGIHGQDTRKQIFSADYAALQPWSAIKMKGRWDIKESYPSRY